MLTFLALMLISLLLGGSSLQTVTVPGGWAEVEKKPLDYDFSKLDEILRKFKTEGEKVIVNPGFDKPPEWVWREKRYGLITRVVFSDGRNLPCISPISNAGEVYKLRYLGHLCAHLGEKFKETVSAIAVGDLGFDAGTERNLSQLVKENFKTWGWQNGWDLNPYRVFVWNRFNGDMKAINASYSTRWRSWEEIIPPRRAEDTPQFRDWLDWARDIVRKRFLQEAVVVRRYGFEVKCTAPLPKIPKLPPSFGKRKPILALTISYTGPYNTFEYLRKVKSIGINFVQIKSAPLGWKGAEPSPGHFNFLFLDSLLATLRHVGLKAIVKPATCDAPPTWLFNEMGDPQKRSACRLPDGRTLKEAEVYSWDIVPPTGNREVEKFQRRYLNALLVHLKRNFSDVVEYIVVGEFIEGEWTAPRGPQDETWTWDEFSLQNYRNFLRRKYGDISALNRKYQTNFADFEEVFPPKIYEESPHFMDWKEWTYQEMARLYRWQSQLARQYGFKAFCLAHNNAFMPKRIYICHRDSKAIVETLDAEAITLQFPLLEYTKGLQLYEGWIGDVYEVAHIYLKGWDGFCTPAPTYEWEPPKGFTGPQMFYELSECIKAMYPTAKEEVPLTLARRKMKLPSARRAKPPSPQEEIKGWGYNVNFDDEKPGGPPKAERMKSERVNLHPTKVNSFPIGWSQPLSVCWVIPGIGDLRNKPLLIVAEGDKTPSISFDGPPEGIKATRFTWDWLSTRDDVNCGSFALVNAKGARLLCITFASTGKFYIHLWYYHSLYAGRYSPNKAVRMQVDYHWSDEEGLVSIWINGRQVLNKQVTVGRWYHGPKKWSKAIFGRLPDGFTRLYGDKGSFAVDNIRIWPLARRKLK